MSTHDAFWDALRARQQALLDAAADADTTPFDYIVVGSGAGGGPLAARLARGGRRVLLLEAGLDPSVAAPQPGNPLRAEAFAPDAFRPVEVVPGYHAAATEDPPMAWEFSVRHYAADGKQARDSKYERAQDPSQNGAPGAGGIQYPRCAAIGGCTAHHAMIVVKPNDQDWDRIAALTGDASWRSEAMQGYFARIEKCLYYADYNGTLRRMLKFIYEWPRRIAQFINPRYQLDWGGHGFDGWMSTSFVDPLLVRRIAEGDAQFRTLLLRVILYLQTRKGALLSLLRSIARFRIVQWLDPNIIDERAQSYQQLKFIPLAIDDKARRCGVREHLLGTARELPEHLVIASGAFVERVVFTQDAVSPAPRAHGVVVQHGVHLYGASLLRAQAERGARAMLYAKREVILCGGAFNTPQMLMLSGIGPLAHLQQVKVRGPRDAQDRELAPPIDLPGVGQHLQDRYEVSVISEAKADFTTVNGLTFRPEIPDPAFAQWRDQQKGLYTINGGALAVFATTDAAPTPYPDLFIFGVPAAFRGYYWRWSHELLCAVKGAPTEQRNLWSWVILKAYTDNGWGTVRLRSNDPYEQVDVCFHSFSEGHGAFQIDRKALARGVALTRDLNRRAGVFANEIQPGAARPDDSAALDEWIEDEAWGHHACGTCRMGSDLWQADVLQLRDRNAVLDSAFRVHGVRGLRVVDASVFPQIPGYFIVTPVLMAGEKAADLLLADDAAYPQALAAAEHGALGVRRARVQAPAPQGEGIPADAVGLALSGGGIRSATFCLGALQALAEKRRIRDIDVMSTVSGGGYVGGFLGRLFTQVDPRVADPAARVESILAHESAQVGWLRRYANYIAGEGRSDWINNLGTIWRNLLSLHVVIGLVLLAGFLVLRYIALRNGWTPLAFSAFKTTWQLSPWIWLPIALCGAWIAPAGLGYWLSQPSPRGGTYPLNAVLIWFALLIGAIGVLDVPGLSPIGLAAVGSLLLAWVWAGVAQWGTAKVVPEQRSVLIRNRLTQGLGNGLWLLAAVLIWIAIDSAAYTALASKAMSYVAALAGAIAAALPVWRSLVHDAAAAIEPATKKWSDRMRLKWRAGMIAIPLALFGLFAVDLAALWLFQVGTHVGLAALVVALLFSLVVGRTLGFVNLSSLQAGYAARLGRTFLGACNDARIYRGHDQASADVRAPHADDDIEFRRYRPQTNGGPLHLVSVCVNDTVDSASGRATREDKGMPMCVGPGGISVGLRYHALWSEKDGTPTVHAIGAHNDPNAFHVLRRRGASEVPVESLRLSQWMAISGAAFTTGAGRDTSLPIALAFGLFNVRLGYWWDSGIPAGDRPGQFPSSFAERVKTLPARLFRTQATVLNEWRARFFGPSERLWYLSDGGGFDNTALYELLRRRLPLMIAVDASYDPNYRFEDLAIVTRNARVDFGAELLWLAPAGAVASGDWGALDAAARGQGLAPPPDWIKRWFDPGAIGAIETITRDSRHAAALAYVRYACRPEAGSWLLLMKPNLSQAVPPDVRAYAEAHADFPHISTVDQFLSEDAWESYRLLGTCIGAGVLRS